VPGAGADEAGLAVCRATVQAGGAWPGAGWGVRAPLADPAGHRARRANLPPAHTARSLAICPVIALMSPNAAKPAAGLRETGEP